MPGRMKIVIDRVANKATEYTNVVESSIDAVNLSQARHWVGLMR